MSKNNEAYNSKTGYSSKYADDNQKKLFKKMPSGHFLSNQKNCHKFLLWNTFYKRNLHRFAMDYLGLSLHLYQIIALYWLGVRKSVTIVATRSSAKSFLIAIYACCMAILYPGIKIVITSATKGQSRLIITEKIKNELYPRSSNLRREITEIKDNIGQEMYVGFKNGSKITVVPASENARGYRSNLLIFEEFRQISKNILDQILMPLQVMYKPECATNASLGYEFYNNGEINAYISSSWIDDGHWMWENVDEAIKGSLNDTDTVLLAFDEAVVLKHKIKSEAFMRRTKIQTDSLSWRTEYLNERVKDNESAFFPYSILSKNQKVYRPFYPRTNSDVALKVKNPYSLKKTANEIRIVSVDMAFVQGNKNDNSIFTCMRLIPESTKYMGENGSDVEIKNGYRRIVSFMESIQGGDTDYQSLRIRQLYEDFDADYIVLDTRNGGISVYDTLAKPMYDPERGTEYTPLICMNNDSYADRIRSDAAEPRIYVINATDKLNSAIAIDFRRVLATGMIDIPVNLKSALDDILPKIPEYQGAVTGEEQVFYEGPFLESQQLIAECIALTTTRNEQTGVITVKEKGKNRKDRYTSVSYGSYFASELERDLISGMEEFEYDVFWN